MATCVEERHCDSTTSEDSGLLECALPSTEIKAEITSHDTTSSSPSDQPQPLSTLAAVQPMAPLAVPPSPRQRHRHLRHSRSASLARNRRVSAASRSSSESKAGKRGGTGLTLGLTRGSNAMAETQISTALAASALLASVGAGLGTFMGSTSLGTPEENKHSSRSKKGGNSSTARKGRSLKSRKSHAGTVRAGLGSQSATTTSSSQSSRSKNSIPRVVFVNVERKGEKYTPPPRGTFRSSYARFLRSEVPDFDPSQSFSAYRLGFGENMLMSSGTNAQSVWARHALAIGPGDMLNPSRLEHNTPLQRKAPEKGKVKSRGKDKNLKTLGALTPTLPSSLISTPAGIVSDPISAYADYLNRRHGSSTSLHASTTLSISEFDLFSAARARAAAADERFSYYQTRFHQDSLRASGSGSSQTRSGTGSKEAQGKHGTSGVVSGDLAAETSASTTESSVGKRSVRPASGKTGASGGSSIEIIPEWSRSPAAPPPPRIRRWLREAAARQEGRSGEPARIEELNET